MKHSDISRLYGKEENLKRGDYMDKEYHDIGEFGHTVGTAIDELIESGWSEKKVAKFLREKARELDPPKPRAKILTLPKILSMTNKQIESLPDDIKSKVRKLREEFSKR